MTALIHGAEYRNSGSGDTYTLLGAKAKTVVLQDGLGETSEVPKQEFLGSFQDTGKHDHTDFCCATHGSHTTPHRGCVLR